MNAKRNLRLKNEDNFWTSTEQRKICQSWSLHPPQKYASCAFIIVQLLDYYINKVWIELVSFSVIKLCFNLACCQTVAFFLFFFAMVRTKPTEEVKSLPSLSWVYYYKVGLPFLSRLLSSQLLSGATNNPKSFDGCFHNMMWFKHCLVLRGKWITSSGFLAGIWIDSKL